MDIKVLYVYYVYVYVYYIIHNSIDIYKQIDVVALQAYAISSGDHTP